MNLRNSLGEEKGRSCIQDLVTALIALATNIGPNAESYLIRRRDYIQLPDSGQMQCRNDLGIHLLDEHEEINVFVNIPKLSFSVSGSLSTVIAMIEEFENSPVLIKILEEMLDGEYDRVIIKKRE